MDDFTNILTSIVEVLGTNVLGGLEGSSLDSGEASEDVLGNSQEGGGGVVLEGLFEVGEEGLVSLSKDGAVLLDVVVVTVEGHNISNQSQRIGLRFVQVLVGLLDIGDEGNLGALGEVLVVGDVELIVETLEEVGEISGGVSLESEVSRGQSNEESESEDSLEHF